MADISAYANIAFCETYDFEYVPKVSSSMSMVTWFDRMSRFFPPDPKPVLLPKWPLNRTL